MTLTPVIVKISDNPGRPLCASEGSYRVGSEFFESRVAAQEYVAEVERNKQ